MPDPKSQLGAVLKLGAVSLSHPSVAATVLRVRRERLTYLTVPALLDLHQTAARIEANNLPGIFIEAGCALGGSAIVLAASKRANRPFYVYDVFGMIPPPSSNDERDAWSRYEEIQTGRSGGIGGDPYYGYQTDLLERVTRNFEQHGFPLDRSNIRLVQGLYEDTLYVTEPVALAHLDCDWHDSVWTCLTRIVPQLVVGGTLIVDDYADYSGCKKAVDRYFADKHDCFAFEKRSRLHIVRLR
ncbi:MAG: TylF/MycF/NovP-related O-methyltransferase [Candidatus Brachytrichaceae bacterium NZ_4S206]|jgi:asparagine synthase (glutamine-hydrolysing)